MVLTYGLMFLIVKLLAPIFLKYKLFPDSQMDGTPPHFQITVRNWVTDNYPRRNGRGYPVAWPPISSDHNPIEFYLWEYMKDNKTGAIYRELRYLLAYGHTPAFNKAVSVYKIISYLLFLFIFSIICK